MSGLENELRAINGRVNRYRAFEMLLFCAAALAFAYLFAAGLDVWLRPRSWGRWLLSSLVALSVIASLYLIYRTLAKKRSSAGVAALLESKFPQLDNRLINNVLFDRESEKTPWLKLYLAQGVPGFGALPLQELKNRVFRKRGAIALISMLAALALPIPFLANNAWTIALARVAMPFRQITPPMFAKVLSIDPGNKTVVQGDGITLSVKATGKAGQDVIVELWPSDDRKATMQIGRFQETDREETFSYRVSKVPATVDYRFIVGDAYPTDRATIKGVPPLALVAMNIKVQPSEYTHLAARAFDGFTNSLSIPVGSKITFTAECNRALKKASLQTEKETLPLAPDAAKCTAETAVSGGNSLVFEAEDGDGLTLAFPIRYSIVEDFPPEVHIASPSEKQATLPPTAAPVLTFEAKDEYGLGKVQVERVRRGASPSTQGEILQEWDAEGAKSFQKTWTGNLEDIDAQSSLRVVAFDGAQEPHRTVSRNIDFAMTKIGEQLKSQALARAEARKTVGELIARQKTALETAKKLQAKLPSFDEDEWSAVKARQEEILAYAETLSRTKDGAIGSARVALGKAIAGPLPQASASLAKVSHDEAEKRADNAQTAVAAQGQVLQLLGFAENSMEKGEISQTQAGLLAILDGIIKGQTANLRATKRVAQSKPEKFPQGIVDTQENLAGDAQAMVGYCRAQAKTDTSDPDFGKLLTEIANKTEQLRVYEGMMTVADIMDNDGMSAIAQIEGSQVVLTNNLESLRLMMKEQRESSAVEQETADHKTIVEARSSVAKLKDLQSKIVEALRGVGGQGDKSEKLDEDTLEEIVELKEQMAEAMLKVATDLQSMPDLDAVNELVTDTFQTYEEMKQTEGSSTNAVQEIGLQKEDWLLDQLAHTGEKMDEMEEFLFPDPDTRKTNTENIDKEEFKSSIGQITMPEELQDIVGDLLKQEEDNAKDADDSYTNQGAADVPMGWGIQEGEWVDYSAAGKSGNQEPDHKDQDGRSQTGRQGMSDGEFMGRTAHINEGDANLDKRMTRDASQAGDVEEEGHSDAVATGGGKNSGYSQNRGMEGGEGAKRQDTKVAQADGNTTESQMTRNYETTYAQAQKSGLPSFGLGKVAAMSRMRDLLQKQNASPKKIDELSKKIRQELRITYSSLENGVSGSDMGSGPASESAESAVSATPDEAPAEYRSMVSDYFKVIGEM